MATDMGMDTATDTVTEKNHRNKSDRLTGVRWLPIVLGCGIFLPNAVFAAERELKFDPSITLRAELHDRNAAVESAKWVLELTPSLNVKYSLADTSLSLRYTPRLFVSDLDGNRSDVIHGFAAQAKQSLFSRRVEIGANAFVGEQSRDPFTPSLTTAQPIGERLRTLSAGLNVTGRDHVAPGVIGELRGNYQFTSTRVVNSEIAIANPPNAHRWTVAAELKPSTLRPPFGWTVGGEYGQRTDGTTQGNEVVTYKTFAGADWNYSAQYALGFRAGYEQSDFVNRGNDVRGPYVDVVTDWRPNARTTTKAQIGWHFYGLGYSLAAQWRGPRLVTDFSARRAIATAQESVFVQATDSPIALLDRYLSGTISDPIARAVEAQRLSNVLNLPGSVPENRYFYLDRSQLEEVVRLSAIYSLPRLTTNAYVQYRETTPSKSELDSLRPDSVLALREWLGSLGAAYRLSQSLTLRADLTNEHVRAKNDSRKLNRVRSSIALAQQWNRAISTGVIVFYDRVQSDNVRSEYDDRGLAAFVRYQFN